MLIAAHRTAKIWEDEAKELAPEKSGRLKEDVFASVSRRRRFSGQHVVNTISVELGVHARHNYYRFPLRGTDPHTIRPRNRASFTEGSARLPALFWEGAEHPIHKVEHPGSKPTDFFDRAVRSTKREVSDAWRDIGKRLIRRAV
jgi:hypothetical protein